MGVDDDSVLGVGTMVIITLLVLCTRVRNASVKVRI